MIIKKLIQLSFVFLFSFNFCACQIDPHWVDGRNTIVHLFEWKFDDIAEECEKFLAPKGYAGVQVSPVAEHVVVENNPWWMRYQPVSYKIHSRSGDQRSFENMTRRCNKVGVRIYADVIINHMAAAHGNGIGGSPTDIPMTNYPAVPYSANDFNQNCYINSYHDSVEVRNCRLNGLPDLNQRTEWVRSKIIDFLNLLIDLGVAGFRVDACKHMWPDDLKFIFNRLHHLNTSYGFPENSKPFIVQEVIDLGGEAVSKYEYTDLGTVTEFKFSNEIGRAFNGKNSLKWFKNFGVAWGLLPTTHALTFVDNHDNQRGHGSGGDLILNYKKSKLYKMATAFHLSFPYGISRIMSSFNFSNTDQGPPSDKNGAIISPQFKNNACVNGWICEHRWRQIFNMIKFKNVAGNSTVENWWDNENNMIAFSRGNKAFIVFNLEENSIERIFQTGLPAGTYCEISSGNKINNFCSGKKISVDANGNAKIILPGNSEDGFLAIHVEEKL